MKFTFGMVIGMDYVPELRLMLVAPSLDPTHRGYWEAIVIDDRPNVWSVGTMVQAKPKDRGIIWIDPPPSVYP